MKYLLKWFYLSYLKQHIIPGKIMKNKTRFGRKFRVQNSHYTKQTGRNLVLREMTGTKASCFHPIKANIKFSGWKVHLRL